MFGPYLVQSICIGYECPAGYVSRFWNTAWIHIPRLSMAYPYPTCIGYAIRHPHGVSAHHRLLGSVHSDLIHVSTRVPFIFPMWASLRLCRPCPPPRAQPCPQPRPRPAVAHHPYRGVVLVAASFFPSAPPTPAIGGMAMLVGEHHDDAPVSTWLSCLHTSTGAPNHPVTIPKGWPACLPRAPSF